MEYSLIFISSNSNSFQEYDVYQLVKKYEWNEKALDEVSNEKLRYKEESSHADGWTEIKRTEKPQPTTTDKNAKEGQKQRRNQKNTDQPADNNGIIHIFREVLSQC